MVAAFALGPRLSLLAKPELRGLRQNCHLRSRGASVTSASRCPCWDYIALRNQHLLYYSSGRNSRADKTAVRNHPAAQALCASISRYAAKTAAAITIADRVKPISFVDSGVASSTSPASRLVL